MCTYNLLEITTLIIFKLFFFYLKFPFIPPNFKYLDDNKPAKNVKSKD